MCNYFLFDFDENPYNFEMSRKCAQKHEVSEREREREREYENL